MVPGAGIEPARHYWQWILSPQRLPFRHPGMCMEDNGKLGFFQDFILGQWLSFSWELQAEGTAVLARTPQFQVATKPA